MCRECAVPSRIWEQEHTRPGPRPVDLDVLLEVGQLVGAQFVFPSKSILYNSGNQIKYCKAVAAQSLASL